MMSVVAGFVIGYVLGRRFGPLDSGQVNQAWDKIKKSEEVQDIVTGGAMMVSQVLQERVKSLASKMTSKS